jgi:hypothetical protein
VGWASTAAQGAMDSSTSKTLAAQAKRHPGRIRPAYIDEQIKRSDGANSQYRAGGFGATKYTLNIGGFVCLYSR